MCDSDAGVWTEEAYTDTYVHVCNSDAGVWTEEEAYKVYREKLVQLRDLYVGQFDHMSHVLQEKRRQFLLQWQYASRRRKPGTHIRGVICGMVCA